MHVRLRFVNLPAAARPALQAAADSLTIAWYDGTTEDTAATDDDMAVIVLAGAQSAEHILNRGETRYVVAIADAHRDWYLRFMQAGGSAVLPPPWTTDSLRLRLQKLLDQPLDTHTPPC